MEVVEASAETIAVTGEAAEEEPRGVAVVVVVMEASRTVRGAPDTHRTRQNSAVTAIIDTEPELFTAFSPQPVPGWTK